MLGGIINSFDEKPDHVIKLVASGEEADKEGTQIIINIFRSIAKSKDSEYHTRY